MTLQKRRGVDALFRRLVKCVRSTTFGVTLLPLAHPSATTPIVEIPTHLAEEGLKHLGEEVQQLKHLGEGLKHLEEGVQRVKHRVW